MADGHEQGRGLARNQPATLAAMEGHFRSGPATLYLFGIADARNQKVDWGLGVPGGLSFLVHDSFQKPLPGLDQFAPDDRPQPWAHRERDIGDYDTIDRADSRNRLKRAVLTAASHDA